MSGRLVKRAVMLELGRTISMPRLKTLDKRHGELFLGFLPARAQRLGWSKSSWSYR
jgi:hypothetical protein